MPVTEFDVRDPYKYIIGFGGYKESEAIEGALPLAANSPQRCPYGLYNEKLSGTAFTAPRHENQQTWLYRILPSASHQSFELVSDGLNKSYEPPAAGRHFNVIPNQLLWTPFDLNHDNSWINSLHLLAGAGDPTLKQGVGYYIYAVGKSMEEKTAFYSADGDFLIVPQHGILDVRTELGRLLVRPSEFCVIPRGIRYHISLHDNVPARGYILELYQGHFQLPELGPIGSNGLANARDFQTPVADFIEDHENTEWTLYGKFGGRLFSARQSHTPFDVVAWHGTYYPYKYDLARFCPLNAVSHDHIDPSIFTVLTAPSIPHGPGTAVADFVVFGPRWNVSEHTFRPPWYHRNTMSEFMGLIKGDYPGDFRSGGANLHNTMSGHGVDLETFEKASTADLVPTKLMNGTMSFMFESCLMVGVTDWGLKTVSNKLQKDYTEERWTPLKVHFKRPKQENGLQNGGVEHEVGEALISVGLGST